MVHRVTCALKNQVQALLFPEKKRIAREGERENKISMNSHIGPNGKWLIFADYLFISVRCSPSSLFIVVLAGDAPFLTTSSEWHKWIKLFGIVKLIMYDVMFADKDTWNFVELRHRSSSIQSTGIPIRFLLPQGQKLLVSMEEKTLKGKPQAKLGIYWCLFFSSFFWIPQQFIKPCLTFQFMWRCPGPFYVPYTVSPKIR